MSAVPMTQFRNDPGVTHAAPVQRRTSNPDLQGALNHYRSRAILQLGPLVFAICVLGTIGFAWLERGEGYLTAETGLGYWLGIAGACLMAMLGLYPLRKRLKIFRSAGRVANWFRAHMVMGILGPALIVLHTNFKLGSLNSRLALYTMLIVVASGIAGRYLYARIHKGLYGQHLDARDILADLEQIFRKLDADFPGAAEIMSALRNCAPQQSASRGLLTSAYRALAAGLRAAAGRRRVKTLLARYISTNPRFAHMGRWQRRKALRAAYAQIDVFFAAVCKADRLAFFERVFGLWHHLHMPLFAVLALTVVLHIVAVHRY